MAYGTTTRRTRRAGVSRPKWAEALEQRVLLSVSDAEYAAIRANYATFELPADASQTNVIDIPASELSVASLAAAIEQAATTTYPDLIILRTTDTQNTITFDQARSFYIDFPDSQGSINIIGLGTKPLTIDAANGDSNIFMVDGWTNEVSLGLGGMVLKGGAHDGDGGALLQQKGRLAMKGVTLRDNMAAYGGGLYAWECEVHLDDVTFQNNWAGSAGGLMLVASDSTLNNVTIVGNSSARYAGGMQQDGGISRLNNVLIAGNTTDLGGTGGGIFFNYATSSLTNVLIADNTATGNGGGIAKSGSDLTLVNVTVSGNRASNGGGIYQPARSQGGSLVINKSVVTLNTATTEGADIYLESGDVSSSRSLIGSVAGSGSLGHGLPGTDPSLLKVKIGYYGTDTSNASRSALVVHGTSDADDIRLTVQNGYLLWSVRPKHRPPTYGARPLCQVASISILAGAGNDYVTASARVPSLSIFSGGGGDTIRGGDGQDTVMGESGKDLVYSGASRDFIDGGTGDDQLYGESGDDVCYGGVGNDSIQGGSGCDMIYGGRGINWIALGRQGSDRIYSSIDPNSRTTDTSITKLLNSQQASLLKSWGYE